jgi:glycosyltransferase involved in cell wall biosynthesis
MIVKNEERFLGQCLKSIREIASQIVVVDTGSTDRTIEIAKEFGAEIHSLPGATISAPRATPRWNTPPATGCSCWMRTRNCPPMALKN